MPLNDQELKELQELEELSHLESLAKGPQDKLQQMFNLSPESQSFRKKVDSSIDSGNYMAAGVSPGPSLSALGSLLKGGASQVGNLAQKASPAAVDILGVVSPRSAHLIRAAQRLAPRASEEVASLESAGVSGLPVKQATVAPESLSQALEGRGSMDPSKINVGPSGEILPNRPGWDFPLRKSGNGVK